MSGPRVLLVDDDKFFRRACEVSLRQRGFEVLTAGDGEEGLRLGSTPPYPDLILLDRVMPRLHGIEVLRALKADPATRHIPIVVFSSSSREQDKAEALEIGAAAYHVKANLSLSELSAEVDHLVRRHEGSR
jgi:DNA-binding response OmpR family regulator